MTMHLVTAERITTVYDLARKCQLYEDNMKTIQTRKTKDSSVLATAKSSAVTTTAMKDSFTKAKTSTSTNKATMPQYSNVEKEKLSKEEDALSARRKNT